MKPVELFFRSKGRRKEAKIQQRINPPLFSRTQHFLLNNYLLICEPLSQARHDEFEVLGFDDSFSAFVENEEGLFNFVFVEAVLLLGGLDKIEE